MTERIKVHFRDRPRAHDYLTTSAGAAYLVEAQLGDWNVSGTRVILRCCKREISGLPQSLIMGAQVTVNAVINRSQFHRDLVQAWATPKT